MATRAGGGAGGGEDVLGGGGAGAVVGGGAGDVLGGGAGAGELHDVPLVAAEICGSSNPTAGDCSLFPAAASALAKAWKASPTDSYRWTSSLGGVE
jgi:hypothetical protein